MESRKEYNTKLTADLLEIAKSMPNGIMVFHNEAIGGSIFRSGDMDTLVHFAGHRLGTVVGEAEQEVYKLTTQILSVVRERYDAKIKQYLDVMKGQVPPCELPLKDLTNFLTKNDLSNFSAIILCCNESHGFFSASGDTVGSGSVLLSAIASGNIPVWDLLTRIKQEIDQRRRKIIIN